MTLFSSVTVGWLGRRVLDWGGWLGSFLLSLIGIYNSLPPTTQQVVQQAISGNWKEITLGALIPIFGLVVSQVMSWRATVKPQVVTQEGNKVPLDALPPSVEKTAEIIATARKSAKPTLLERLRGMTRR